MGKLILIRHGQTDMNKDQLYYGRLDVPINETGKEQAENTRKNLVELEIDYDKIYSSPMKRAYETAEIVNYKNLEIEKDDELREMTTPPVRIAISSSISLRRSPKPGAFTAQIFS